MRVLKDELETFLGAYYLEAPEDATYPYSVFELRRLSEVDGRQSYALEINTWDKHKYYSRAESIMDAFEQKLNGVISLSDNNCFMVFNGQRQPIIETDKSIKRIREQFELYCYER